MNTHADKTQENKGQPAANGVSRVQTSGESIFQFVDNRSEAVAQWKLQKTANNSPRVSLMKDFQGMANNSSQAQQSAQMEAMATNKDQGLENEADVMDSRALKIRHSQKSVREVPLQKSAAPIQRSIGLEIEVAVPVDELTANDEDDLRDAAGNDTTNIPKSAPLELMNLRSQRVAYTRGDGPKASNGNYRAEVDHDPRVNCNKVPAFPYRDMNNDALLEIVTEPKKDKAEFDAAMDDVDDFVGDVNTRTGNLTRHAHDPYGSGHNLGPMDYPDLGAMPREASHNWNGSIQVNIGIDMREYGSLAKWYAKSTYADPSKADVHARQSYKDVKKNIIKAVNVGRDIPKWISGKVTKAQKAQMGNMRGIRGWATHMALYMLGGKGGLPGSTTAKNITPILMKSPNHIAIHYGMTAEEKAYYLTNRTGIVSRLIAKTGRTDLNPEDPLSGNIVEGDGEEGDLSDLSGDTGDVLFAGAPIGGQQPVGPARGDVTVPNTDAGDRGGAVVEFRNLPGFYEGPERWRQVGHDFLREAENRNKRGGKKPDKLSKLQGPEWD